MSTHAMVRNFLLVLMSMLALAFSLPAMAAEAAKTVTVQPNQVTVLDSAKCISQTVKNPGAEIVTDSAGVMHLHYTPPVGQTAAVTISALFGSTLENSVCKDAAERRYNVSVDGSGPAIAPAGLAEAFRILVAAFVLAVLLESAFELLFNWRLFQEYFVGKAWRTPIMFAIALLVVKQFGFDPLAQVFQAYRAGAAPLQDAWLTSVLSAMILAGGSVAVNRIMTSLGIRSPFPKAEQERARLSDKEAYLSVTVRAPAGSNHFAVNMTDAPADPSTPQVLGIIGSNAGGRLRNLLFPTRLRVPRSGGMRVSVDRSYCISVTDLRTGDVYDIYGKPMAAVSAPVLRFAPRAFIDIIVVPLGHTRL